MRRLTFVLHGGRPLYVLERRLGGWPIEWLWSPPPLEVLAPDDPWQMPYVIAAGERSAVLRPRPTP